MSGLDMYFNEIALQLAMSGQRKVLPITRGWGSRFTQHILENGYVSVKDVLFFTHLIAWLLLII